MLKETLTKSEYSELDNVLQVHYEKADSGDGYVLSNTKRSASKEASLKKQIENLKRENSELTDKVNNHDTEMDSMTTQLSMMKESNSEQSKIVENNINKIKREADLEVKHQTSHLVDKIKEMTAMELSRDLALPGAEHLLLPHMKAKLDVDWDGKALQINYLDKDGNKSYQDRLDFIDDLKKDDRYKMIIKGNQSQGSHITESFTDNAAFNFQKPSQGNFDPNIKHLTEYKGELDELPIEEQAQIFSTMRRNQQQ